MSMSRFAALLATSCVLAGPTLAGVIEELPIRVRIVPADDVVIVHGDGIAPTSPAGPCPPVTSALTDHDFSQQTFAINLMGGFAESETAAAQYLLSADDFPIILNEAQIVIGTSNTSVTTTTQWSILVWDGPPNTGNLVAEFNSDDISLPHVTLPPGNNGVYLIVQTDPKDPIVIPGNHASNSFTVGFRIDVHNNQTADPCTTAPPFSQNAFPGVDLSGVASPNHNWLGGVNCGPFGCPSNGGFASFSNIICPIPGDWVMNATWTSAACTTFAGACCAADATCDVTTQNDCETAGGLYQGDGMLCGDVQCDALGACCFGATCNTDFTQKDCLTSEGEWLGAASDCSGASPCVDIGACCLDGDTCIDGAGSGIPEDDCILVGGTFQGDGTDCLTTVCNPLGACCLGDGSCIDAAGAGVTPEDCATAGGVFQGNASTCGGVTCPIPTGACCLASGSCVTFIQADCENIAGATWAGPNTDCADACDTCPEDVDGNGDVGFSDLVAVLAQWGACPGCPEDVDGDDLVGFTDVVAVLAAWGPC